MIKKLIAKIKNSFKCCGKEGKLRKEEKGEKEVKQRLKQLGY